MSEYVEGMRLILVVIALLLRLNGFVLIYLRREKVWLLPPIILNLFSPLLCIITLSYVTSKGWKGLGKGNTLGDTLTLMFILLGSQVFSGMIFMAGLFVLDLGIPAGRAVGPAADPINFLPVYLLAVLGLSSLLVLCMLRMIMPGTSPVKMLKGNRILETTIMIYLVLIPIQLLIWGYGWVLGDAGFKAPTNPFMHFDIGADIIYIFISIVILAPLIEEVFFRGYMFKLLLDQLGDNPAILVTSVLFAVVHINLYTFLPILIMGGVMGWARKRTGSIVPSLVMHSMNNLIALTVVIIS
jgi:membrane protease YdiL (CAAX protease family)